MLYSFDLRLCPPASALRRLTLRPPRAHHPGRPSSLGTSRPQHPLFSRTADGILVCSCILTLILKTQERLREASAPGNCVALCCGSLSFVLSFLWSQQPSPRRAAGDLGPDRGGAPGASPPSPVLVSGAGWTYSSVQWATSRACAGPLLGGVGPPRGNTLPFLPGTRAVGAGLHPRHSCSRALCVRPSGTLPLDCFVHPHPFPEPSLRHRGGD